MKKKHADHMSLSHIDKKLSLMDGNGVINVTVITCTYLMKFNAMRLE